MQASIERIDAGFRPVSRRTLAPEGRACEAQEHQNSPVQSQDIFVIEVPIREPILDFGTVVILSTIRRHGVRSPLLAFGSMGNRNRGPLSGPW